MSREDRREKTPIERKGLEFIPARVPAATPASPPSSDPAPGTTPTPPQEPNGPSK